MVFKDAISANLVENDPVRKRKALKAFEAVRMRFVEVGKEKIFS